MSQTLESTPAFLSLNDILPGEWAVIHKIKATGPFRKRLAEMGFIENTPIYVEKCAPLNDPIEYVIRGFHVSLRRTEAAQIIVTKKGSAA